MEDPESPSPERPHCHDSEEQEDHDKQDSQAVIGVDVLSLLVTHVQIHLGEVISHTQVHRVIEVLQGHADVVSNIVQMHEVVAYIISVNRFDVQGRITDWLSAAAGRVLHIRHLIHGQ